MKWFDREIFPMRHRYNCQINDDVYPPPFGWVGKMLLKLHHVRHNVPTDGCRSGERSIEVPLAIDFISHHVKDEPIVELGCVLPYYILKSGSHSVYDLMDRHPQNVSKDIRDMSDADLQSNIISISTLEHIDKNEYGIASEGNVSAIDILKRVRNNSKRHFMTFPLGHNRTLDEYVLSSTDLGEIFVTRTEADPEDWMVVDKKDLTDEMKRYGTYLNANTICVLMKV